MYNEDSRQHLKEADTLTIFQEKSKTDDDDVTRFEDAVKIISREDDNDEDERIFDGTDKLRFIHEKYETCRMNDFNVIIKENTIANILRSLVSNNIYDDKSNNKCKDVRISDETDLNIFEKFSSSEYFLPSDLYSDDESDTQSTNSTMHTFENLESLIHSNGFFDPITTPINVSPGELLFMILKISTVNKMPVTALSNSIALINSIFLKPILPQSRYMIDKYFNTNHNTSFYATCPKCYKYIGNIKVLDVVNCQIL